MERLTYWKDKEHAVLDMNAENVRFAMEKLADNGKWCRGMTEQEAIEIFKSRLEISDYEKQIPEYCQATRMAVEALKTMIELEKRKLTLSDLENYIKFEDECVKKNFTFKSLIEAREKQTPKIPTYEGDGYDPEGNIIFDEWLCPSCGTRYEVDYDEHDFCPNCGQAIDWSEKE